MSKYLKIIGASVLSAGLLIGCANNDDVDPAPEDNNIINDDINDNDMDGVNIPGDDGNNGDVIDNGGNGSNDNTDINVPGDDNNPNPNDHDAPADELMDNLDNNDRDNR